MAEDNAKLQRAQERLLEAMEHAASALDNLEAGNAGQAQDTCSRFLEAVEESQVLLLQVASKQQATLPYALDASAARLEAAAKERELQAQARERPDAMELDKPS